MCTSLCDPMNWSTPGFPVLSYLPGFAQNLCPLSQWCHPTISSSVTPVSSCPQSFPVSGSFPLSQLFAWGGQRIAVSASTPVLPVNIHNWFPLGLTGLISLQPKELSSILSAPQLESTVHVQYEAHFGKKRKERKNFLLCLILLSLDLASHIHTHRHTHTPVSSHKQLPLFLSQGFSASTLLALGSDHSWWWAHPVPTLYVAASGASTH